MHKQSFQNHEYARVRKTLCQNQSQLGHITLLLAQYVTSDASQTHIICFEEGRTPQTKPHAVAKALEKQRDHVIFISLRLY